MVHDLFPLALRGVEHRGYRHLVVGMIARDVEEFLRRAWHATPESMDEGGTHRPILERRDGVVVGCARKLGVALGEALYVLAKALPGLLLAIAQLPLFPGCMYVPWKLPTKTRRRSVQSWILSRGRCLSHVRAESPR
jgi:hypothetical protein